MATVGTQHFRTLDALRGAAALAVALMHWSKLGGFNPLPSAYLAVDLFFMLSGFVIAYAYDRRLAAGLGVRRFMAQRLIRLYPLYLLGTLLAAALVVAGIDASWSRAGLAQALGWGLPMLPLPPWLDGLDDHGTLYPLNDPAWSLLFELLVNLAFVLLHRWLRLRVLALWIGLGALALVLAGIDAGSLERGWSWAGFGVGAGRVNFAFPLGVLLFRLHAAGRLPRWRLPAWLVVALMLAVMALPTSEAPYELWRDLAIVTLLLPGLVVLGVNSEARVAAPFADWLGVISYPLYVLHAPMMGLLFGLADARGLSGFAVPLPWRVAALAGLVLLCAPIAKRGDAPLRRWLNLRLLA